MNHKLLLLPTEHRHQFNYLHSSQKIFPYKTHIKGATALILANVINLTSRTINIERIDSDNDNWREFSQALECEKQYLFYKNRNGCYITLYRSFNTVKIIDRANEPRVRYKRIIWRWERGAGVSRFPAARRRRHCMDQLE